MPKYIHIPDNQEEGGPGSIRRMRGIRLSSDTDYLAVAKKNKWSRLKIVYGDWHGSAPDYFTLTLFYAYRILAR
jgi:hypothetical protein